MLNEIVKTFAENAISQIQKNIREKDPTGKGPMNNTGKMADSLKWRFDGKELIIYSTEKYITVLETGRKPGKMAPPETIQAWVKTKLGKSDDKEVKSIAYLINKKISEKGSLLYQRGGNSGILSSVINEEYVNENLTERLFAEFVKVATNEYLK